MTKYKTAEVAAIIGIHPNTVRLYEELELIPKPRRQPNGYRIFTDVHIEQFRLARLAFQIEVLQNGLRKKIIQMVKVSAGGDYDTAAALTQEYLKQVRRERKNAEEAVEMVKQILSGKPGENKHFLKRKEVSGYLDISMDTLRNWEMNGLLKIRRRENGYRVYTDEDIRRLKIIRHMLSLLSENPDLDIGGALNTPKEDTDIIAVCDKLMTSLSEAEQNALKILDMLQKMKNKFS